LDHAEYLEDHDDAAGAAAALDEARAIGVRLGCLPVVARADAVSASVGTSAPATA
jgi:hypothetical protein